MKKVSCHAVAARSHLYTLLTIGTFSGYASLCMSYALDLKVRQIGDVSVIGISGAQVKLLALYSVACGMLVCDMSLVKMCVASSVDATYVVLGAIIEDHPLALWSQHLVIIRRTDIWEFFARSRL